MGINGLLPQLKSVAAKVHVTKYSGQRAAVDAYVLLHRGAYTCAREICEGEPTDKCTEYCMGRIQLLLNAGVIPVVVFDGGRLPNKDDEEKSRQRAREENKAKARALWQQGNRTAAFECYSRAVDISPVVAKGFIDALKLRGVEFIVAPYEADAQMAYLALNGLVDVVITEDSDLLTYGCPRVLFKMDKSGEGEEIELRNLVHARELSFLGFTHEMFQEMCILAGCDFVKGLPGIGIKKAHQQIRQRRSFLKVVRNLRFSGTSVPPDYEKRVQRAIWTFQHQRVFCPRRCAVVHLHEVQGGSLAHNALVPAAAELVDGEEDFLGPQLPDNTAQAIAVGELDPITKQPYTDCLPCTAPQEQDNPAPGSKRPGGVQGDLRQIMAGLKNRPARQHGSQLQAGRHRAQQGKANSNNNGNTLAKYGFLRNSSSVEKEFKRPRMAAEPPEGGAQQQQQRQQQQQQQRQQREGSGALAVDRAAGSSFLQELQPAYEEQQTQFDVFAAGRGPAGAPRPAAGQPAPAARSGAASLLAKLRGDLQEPSIDELLQQHQGQQDAGTAEEGEEEGADVAAASPGATMRAALTPLGLVQPSSPTLDELLQQTAGQVVIPDSPEASPGQPPHLGGPVSGGGGTGWQLAAQAAAAQITPGFYRVPESEDKEGAAPLGSPLLSRGRDQEAADNTASTADDAIASLDHVEHFAREARSAVDRAALQAVSDALPVPVHVQPPAYLRRQQHLQQQNSLLKRPFAVPRKAGAEKENAEVAAGGKRGKQEEAGQPQQGANLFARFTFK